MADKGNFLAPHKLQIKAFQHVLGAVVLVNSLQFGVDFTRVRCRRKLKPHLPIVFVVNLNNLDAVQFFNQRLRKGGLAGFCAKAVYQILGILNFFVLIHLGLALLFANFVAERQVLEVGNIVVIALAQYQLEGAVGRVVQEGSVVRNQYDGLIALGQEFLKPEDGFNV